LAIRVLLRTAWKTGEKTVSREAISISINAHGARLKLLSKSPPTDRIVLENIANRALRVARIISVTGLAKEPGAYIVNVEFTEPSPEFWGQVYSYSLNGVKLVHVDERLLVK
jgi:hypothetical protein